MNAATLVEIRVALLTSIKERDFAHVDGTDLEIHILAAIDDATQALLMISEQIEELAAQLLIQ